MKQFHPSKGSYIHLAIISVLLVISSSRTDARAQTYLNPTPTPGMVNEDELYPVPTFEAPQSMPDMNWFPPLYGFPHALSPHDHFFFIRPIEEIGLSWPLPDYRYGYYFEGLDNLHTGVDLAAPLHHPIVAAAAGKVVFAGYGLARGVNAKDDPYGIAVMIKHSFGFDGLEIFTVYAHLERTLVSYGQDVESGEKIGLVGMTGLTSGPHLHFEVRVHDGQNSKIQNPELWLLPPVGYGVLAGRIANDYGTLLTSKEIWLKSLETGKSWTIVTYSPKIFEGDHFNDAFYQENYVLFDLPQGSYEISTWFNYAYLKQRIEIIPGAVNFVHMDGNNGFTQASPLLDDSTNFLK